MMRWRRVKRFAPVSGAVAVASGVPASATKLL
jgi:hypothetical protein